MKTYKVNEIFFSLQGEGVRAGTPNVFVRFSNCNLACRKEGPMQFDCDTEFESGKEMMADDVLLGAIQAGNGCRNVIFTGGEPTLQLDNFLTGIFRRDGFYMALETNGTLKPDIDMDWICLSPKSAEHTLKWDLVDELKYVRRVGQEIPQPKVKADHYLISPAFEVDGTLRPDTLAWCIDLVKKNPKWRLSMQLHKFWGVR